MHGCSIAMLPLWANVWGWLSSGLHPPPLLLVFVTFVICAATGIFLNLVGLLPVPEFVLRVLVYPFVEELTCRVLLVGALMTVLRPSAAPQTTVLCGTLFGLMHVITALKTGDPLRVLDGLIVGYFNTIACLVYLRIFAAEMLHQPLSELTPWLAAYGSLVLAHVVYNLLAVLFKRFQLLRRALIFGGALFSVAAWMVFMPRL